MNMKYESHLKQRKVDLLSVSVLLFVDARVEILHIQDNTQ